MREKDVNKIKFVTLPSEIIKKMIAVVEIAGKQYTVKKDDVLFVDRQEGEEGTEVSFSNVLLAGDDKKYKVGTPYVENASVTCTLDEHLKGDKVVVFKKKRRKGYQVTKGHRQFLTKLKIKDIKA